MSWKLENEDDVKLFGLLRLAQLVESRSCLCCGLKERQLVSRWTWKRVILVLTFGLSHETVCCVTVSWGTRWKKDNFVVSRRKLFWHRLVSAQLNRKAVCFVTRTQVKNRTTGLWFSQTAWTYTTFFINLAQPRDEAEANRHGSCEYGVVRVF